MIVWLKYNFGCSTGNNANIIMPALVIVVK